MDNHILIGSRIDDETLGMVIAFSACILDDHDGLVLEPYRCQHPVSAKVEVEVLVVSDLYRLGGIGIRKFSTKLGNMIIVMPRIMKDGNIVVGGFWGSLKELIRGHARSF